MLCSQIQLQDRRSSARHSHDIRLQRSFTPGIIQRPCLIKNLENNCNNNATTEDNMTPRPNHINHKKIKLKEKPQLIVVSLKMQSDAKTLAQEDVKRDPRRMPFYCEQYKQNKKDHRHQQQQQQHFSGGTGGGGGSGSGSISSTTTTLTTTTDHQLLLDHNNNLLKDLIVRGVEMLTTQNLNINTTNHTTNNNININENSNDLNDLYANKYYQFLGDARNYNFNDIEYGNDANLNPNSLVYSNELMEMQLTDCCQCMRDVKLFKKDEDDLIATTTTRTTGQTTTRSNGGGGSNGMNETRNRTQDSRFLTVTSGYIDGSQINNHSGNINCPLKPLPSATTNTGLPFMYRKLKKLPSPRTRQVINITMNTRK